MILVVDNQSKLIASAFVLMQWLGIPFYCVWHNDPAALDNLPFPVTGVVLSGGPGNPEIRNDLMADTVALMRFNVPVLGLCLGHEIINHYFGGTLVHCSVLQDKMESVKILDPKDPIARDLPEKVELRKSHSWEVDRVAPNLQVMGTSSACKVEIIRHRHKPIYGFQSHPEVSGIHGEQILKNFFSLCGYGSVKR